MDVSSLLDQFLQSAKDIANQGKDIAEEKLNIPAEGEARDAALSNLGKGAAITGVLAVLFGTRAGRSVSKAAISVGSIAALGSVAYNTYQKWKNDAGSTVTEAPKIERSEQHDTVLLQAMIMAAKADGEVTDDELRRIKAEIDRSKLQGDVQLLLQDMLDKPVDPQVIAQQVLSEKMAAEVYLVSLLVTHKDNEKEQAYLTALVESLGLADDFVAMLDAEIAKRNTTAAG